MQLPVMLYKCLTVSIALLQDGHTPLADAVIGGYGNIVYKMITKHNKVPEVTTTMGPAVTNDHMFVVIPQ